VKLQRAPRYAAKLNEVIGLLPALGVEFDVAVGKFVEAVD